jgi:hypothetical protein
MESKTGRRENSRRSEVIDETVFAQTRTVTPAALT